MSKEKLSAFPFYLSNDHAGQMILGDSGMTLRDYFANSAIQGMLSNPSMFDILNGNAFEIASKYSYELADAMLKQREL